MKRMITMFFAVLLMVLIVPTTAMAADEVTLTITADKSTVNPGDTITFTVSIGPVGEPGLGGLEFELLIPEGMTIMDESVSGPEGLEEILDSDGEILIPRNDWPKWSYSAQDRGYTGNYALEFLTFSCSVGADVELGEKSMGMAVETCFDNSDTLEDYNTTIVPASFTVEKAKIPVSSVTLDQNTLTLKEGESAKLTATVIPADADNTAVTWSSDNSSIAAVAADGTVTAVKSGTANISVTTEDGGKTASCAVTVTCVHVMNKTEAVAPTCEQDGNIEYYTCSKCGKKFADEAGTEELTDVVVKAKGHTGNEWMKDEESHWKVCGVCGKVYDKEAHAYKWITDKAATEDETGLAHEECGVCGSRRNEGTVTDKLDHVHTDIQHHEAVAAYCVAKGNVEYWTCSSEKCDGKYYGDAACQVVLEGIETPVDPDNHVENGKWDRTAEKHIYTCACGTVLVDEAHKYESDSDSDCDVCGYKRFYVVTAGANAVYEIGAENGLTITADGDYELFKELQVDGRVIDAANYEVKEGSTVVTLKKSYLDTLSSGEHTVSIVYTDGKIASTGFTVKAKEGTGDNNGNGAGNNGENGTNSNTDSDTEASKQLDGAISPKTGDEGRLTFWSLLAVSSLGLIGGMAVYNRKQKRK